MTPKKKTTVTRMPDLDTAHEGAMAFEVTKAVDPTALTAVLSEAVGITSSVIIDGNNAEASADAPILVWVVAPGAAEESVQAAIEGYELEEPVEDEEPPPFVFDPVIVAGKSDTLTPEEIEAAIRYLLRKERESDGPTVL